jgi:hypothetical protein
MLHSIDTYTSEAERIYLFSILVYAKHLRHSEISAIVEQHASCYASIALTVVSNRALLQQVFDSLNLI